MRLLLSWLVDINSLSVFAQNCIYFKGLQLPQEIAKYYQYFTIKILKAILEPSSRNNRGNIGTKHKNRTFQCNNSLPFK